MKTTRRAFIRHSAATLGAFSILPSYVALGNKSSTGRAPSEKVRLAIIGIGNQGNRVRERMVASRLCDVVALCDVDMNGKHTHLSRFQHGLTNKMPQHGDTESPPEVHPVKAKSYSDFRKMLDINGR